MSAVPQGQAADSPMLNLVNIIIVSESTVACPQSDHDHLVRPGELVESVLTRIRNLVLFQLGFVELCPRRRGYHRTKKKKKKVSP